MDVKTLIEKQKDVLESIGIPFEIIEYLVYYYLTNQTIYNKREGKFIYREDDDIVYSNFISDIEDGLFYRENAKHGIMDKRFYIFGELEVLINSTKCGFSISSKILAHRQTLLWKKTEHIRTLEMMNVKKNRLITEKSMVWNQDIDEYNCMSMCCCCLKN